MATPDDEAPRVDAVITMDDWRPWHLRIAEVATPTEDELKRVSGVYLVPLRDQDLPRPLLVQHGGSGDFLLFVREGSEETDQEVLCVRLFHDSADTN